MYTYSKFLYLLRVVDSASVVYPKHRRFISETRRAVTAAAVDGVSVDDDVQKKTHNGGGGTCDRQCDV